MWELFELCETIPKVQCSQCLFYWNQGIVYSTFGQFLVESESRRKFSKLRLDALSIPHHVIKKGRCQGARHGRTEEQKEYHIAWNAWKRCCNRVHSQGEHFTCIHDRFLRDRVYRESQLAIGWTEQKCKKWDEVAKQNHTYHLSTVEFKRYQGQWHLTLNKSGKIAPMRLRSDFRAAVSHKKTSSPRVRRTGCRTNTKKEMALFLKRIMVGHVRLELVEVIIYFLMTSFCNSWFRLQSMARSTVTDGGCRQIHLTRHFSHALHTR